MKTMTVMTSTVLTAAMLMSSGASALPGPPGDGEGSGEGFANLYSQASGNGDCSVNRVRSGSSTLYIPSNRSDSNAQFNVLVWGNGTGGGATTYSTLLESVASHCIAVAAANTANSGDGSEMQDALNTLRSRYGNILRSDHKVCTAGHSQGGGGSFNAANLVDADCVIPVQPDTRFTTRIRGDLDRDVEVITLWGENDTLAPASGNRRNVEGASTILTQVETDGESHFAPTSRSSAINVMFNMANIAQLSNDPSQATEFRGAFWGPTTPNTATTSNRNLSDVRRNSAAQSTAP